jgi:hypothetical protein
VDPPYKSRHLPAGKFRFALVGRNPPSGFRRTMLDVSKMLASRTNGGFTCGGFALRKQFVECFYIVESGVAPDFHLGSGQPISRVHAACQVMRKAGMRPVAWHRHPSVLDRVVVDVIHMSLQIIGVANLMLPISTLPNAALPAGNSRRRSPFARGQASTEIRLDSPPTCCKVGVPFGKSPKPMHVLGQYDPRKYRKRPTGLFFNHTMAKLHDLPNQKVVVLPY